MLAIALCVTSYPALTGGWIYDDFTMLGHPFMDGFDDVRAVFSRDSDEYILYDCIATEAPPKGGGATYRPLSMATLIGVNAAVGYRPLVHHAVSLALHLLVVLLLLRLAAGSWRGRVSWGGAFVVAVFALHPALGEAYHFINGRSDVLAGVGLAALAVVVQQSLRESTSRRAMVMAAWALVAATIGVFAKETFVPAAAFLWLAFVLRDGPDQSGLGTRARQLLPTLAAVGAATAGMFVLRAQAVKGVGGASTVSALLRDDAFFDHLPRLIVLGAETLIAPVPRPMRGLAYELAQPWSPGEIAVLSLCVALTALLVWKRQWRTLTLLTGAAVTLAPTAHVAGFFWLGLDRYLYMPAVLVVVAALEHVPALEAWLRKRTRPEWLALPAAAALLWLAAANFITAGYYSSASDFALAMAVARPNDPTPFIFRANDAVENDNPDAARELLSNMPSGGLTPVLVRFTSRIYRQLGDEGTADQLIEASYEAHPDDPQAQFIAMTLRGEQQRYDEAFELALTLVDETGFCRATKDEVREWVDAGGLTEILQTRAKAMANEHRCER